MSKIISIGTAVPAFCHQQEDILHFMQNVFAMNETDKRKLKFLYHQAGIEKRYSVMPDYSREIQDWKFYPHSENLEPFPSLETRMHWFNKYAPPLSVDAVRNCIEGYCNTSEITHLITVSCTGMSAPGLDLQVVELLDLPKNIFRTSVNFMGCYAALHALKMADAICKTTEKAKVMIVCTELCTLHFQRENTTDNITSSLLFGDGSAAALITNDNDDNNGLQLDGFYAEILTKGKRDMAWELSSSGFLMTLSGYIPELVEEDFAQLTERAFHELHVTKDQINKWCIHPGGKRILDAIHRSLQLKDGDLQHCFQVLNDYGNMSSPTILYVLNTLMKKTGHQINEKIFAAAFGPGLTMETLLLTAV